MSEDATAHEIKNLKRKYEQLENENAAIRYLNDHHKRQIRSQNDWIRALEDKFIADGCVLSRKEEKKKKKERDENSE